MKLTNEQRKGKEVLHKIIEEAWNNETFKQSLLSDPEKTLEAFFGKSLPNGKKIKVTDQSDPEYLYINIPIKPYSDFEIKEKKLNKVVSSVQRTESPDFDDLSKN
ncbi:NHLP leader peptide family RiPP precursor [Chryseobacterium sp. MMS23-Vi53]|uniref:NHLP leader peptide family RiPP precursor n=1 Tax=Chryseobacterium sp. MMS23-Vi53 TaxID=3386644 RepID=UPI0039E912D7